MINWKLKEKGFDPEKISSNGNKFFTGNGYMGIRGTLQEFDKSNLARRDGKADVAGLEQKRNSRREDRRSDSAPLRLEVATAFPRRRRPEREFLERLPPTSTRNLGTRSKARRSSSRARRTSDRSFELKKRRSTAERDRALRKNGRSRVSSRVARRNLRKSNKPRDGGNESLSSRPWPPRAGRA